MAKYILLRWTGQEYTTPGDTIEADPETIGARLADIEAERGGQWAAQADDKVRAIHLADRTIAAEPAPEAVVLAPVDPLAWAPSPGEMIVSAPDHPDTP